MTSSARGWICAALERAGYHADGAASGPQGLAFAASRVYDALVVDQALPGLPGLEVLHALIDSDVLVPAVFVTGHGVARFRDRAIALGVVECLGKPIRFMPLVRAVDRAVCTTTSSSTGAAAFQTSKGHLVTRLAHTLVTTTEIARDELLRLLIRVVAHPRLSLTEFVTVSGVLRCVADAIDGAVGASFLTGLAESLKVKDTQSTNQLLDVFLGLLDRDLSACCLPIDELARKLGSQPLHLERACVPLNMTPAMCRTAYQMRRIVRALIEGPDEHVKQIAYQVGYRHPPNLTRAFRVYFGLPPQDFRSLWRGQACR